MDVKKYTDRALTKMLGATSDVVAVTEFKDASGISIRKRTSHKGTTIAFIFKKWQDGVEHKRVIGHFPRMSIEAARAAYGGMLGELIHTGEVPLGPRKAKLAEAAAMAAKESALTNTFERLWGQFLDKKAREVSAITFETYAATDNIIKHAEFFGWPIGDVGPQVVHEKLILPELERNLPTSTKRIVTHLSGFGSFLEAMGVVERNPYDRLSKLLPKFKGGHHPTFADDRLEESMSDLFARFSKFSEHLQAVLQFHFYVPLRVAEVASITLEQARGASEVVVKTKTWDQFTMPLPTQAQRLVEYFSRHSKYYLIESPRGGKHTGDNIRRALQQSGVDFTIHSVRSCFMQYMQGYTNVQSNIAEMCLSHRVGDATVQAYNRGDYVEKRRAALQEWADFVEKCIGPYAIV